MITLRCQCCSREMRVERASYDPPAATVLVMSECDRCNSGDFESIYYLDANGKEVLQEAP